MTEMMRAARLVGPRRLEVEERERPRPAAGEVLLRIDGCGVCGSNVPPWTGEAGVAYPMAPGEPGHEAWGTVAAVGEGVSGLQEGQAVAALTYRSFAEYDVAAADRVVALPESLAGRPVPGEPIACAVNVTRRAAVAEGDVVVVVGAGFLGALVIQLLARGSEGGRPRRIVAVSRRRASLAAAEAAGADDLLTYDDDVDGHVHAITGGGLADVVLEATGAQAPLDLAGRLVRVRGRLVIAGFHQGGRRSVDLQLWNWRGLDVINAHERDEAIYLAGLRRGVELLAAGDLDLDPLLTHRFGLAEAEQAFRVAEERPDGFVKSLVMAS
ncbi:MAG TPA: zinc-binding dehydrogenase [Thermoanaerobaculia bacterium]|nr:zinc-binding dehydrogenase [Thermoanaerobaculia bacterium]